MKQPTRCGNGRCGLVSQSLTGDGCSRRGGEALGRVGGIARCADLADQLVRDEFPCDARVVSTLWLPDIDRCHGSRLLEFVRGAEAGKVVVVKIAELAFQYLTEAKT